MSQQSDTTLPFRFFLPGRIIVMVSHPEALPNNIRSQVNDQLKADIRWDDYPAVSIPGNEEQRVTMFLVGTIPKFISLETDPTAWAKEQKIQDAAFVERIDEWNEQLPRKDDHAGYTIQAVTPDWLMSGAPASNGTGGPGARPIPAYPATATSHEFDVPDLFQSHPNTMARKDAGPVTVVILDTAPPEGWETTRAELMSKNALLNSLVGKLHIERIGSAALGSMSSSSDNRVIACGHDYMMTDHGLFVAGIIHSIAPQANLHLVRVLGDYGVGSLSSIIAGFKTVFDLIDKGEAKNSTVLINMSLTLNSPLLNDFDCGRIEWRKLADSLKLTMDWHKVERAMQGVLRSFLPRDGAHPLFDMLDPARKAARALIQSADYHLRLIQPLVFLCDAAESRGIRMVAAAGNDSVPGRRLPARYPAAYPSVIGVGALQKNRTTAPYSDESDQPLSDGILTFGGGIGPVKVDACGCEVADTVDGVLGLYVGRFPDGSPSTNGWAYWSGTSFAAPVVTGTIARHCLGGADPGSVKSALMASGSTEHQMRVDQG